MKKTISLLSLAFIFLFSVNGNGQTESISKFIVAGHAYGAHGGKNIGLHPPLHKKLAENKDSTINKIFLTGDIVNKSNSESWEQVEMELDSLGLESFYVMGNHDDNYIGYEIFRQKHGDSYYSFTDELGLFIVLNSTESGRSISVQQLDFLKNTLKSSDSNSKNIFVFFHEILWNSHEKYEKVRSNSRSRYGQIEGYSNFWDEVMPILKSYPEKEYFVIAGDLGGNPDAIAAFYDKWENVSLIASGMGEVENENYLQVNVLEDTVEFELVPLRNNVELKTINWYSVPEISSEIYGATKISSNQQSEKYSIEPVFNATNYNWTLSEGISGESDSSSININFDVDFEIGKISVIAEKDGFGESEPVVLQIERSSLTLINETKSQEAFFAFQNEHFISVQSNLEIESFNTLKVYNAFGTLILNQKLELKPGLNSNVLNKNLLPKGMVILELSSFSKKHFQKLILY